MEILAGFVRILHMGVIAWMLWAPFSSSLHVVRLHVILAPFLMMHWATSTDGCALTLLESRLRGIPPHTSFIHSVVSPIYVISDADVRRVAWITTLVLWGVSLRRLGVLGP
jgi:MFS-type transporter involved in bile tolerance (Atg22 family)